MIHPLLRGLCAAFPLILATSEPLAIADNAVTTANYAETITFRKGIRIQFPGFVLEYIGQRRESSPKYPRGFLFYDFVAKSGEESVKVSWSSGTGDIAPANFRINGGFFALELKRSDRFGPLKGDQLVVSGIIM